jgi:preprotein translocase subunit YajC
MDKFLSDLKSGILVDLLAKFSAFIPRLAIAIIVLLIGWSLAKLIANLIKNLLIKLKIDQLGDKVNDVDFMQSNQIQVKPSTILSMVIYYILLLIFIIAATDIIGVQVISNFVNNILNYIPKLLTALLIILVGIFASDLIGKAVKTTCESLGIPSAKIISAVVFYLMLITVTVSALAQADINTAFLASNITVIIGAGALAFAIGYGLASRDLVSNYLASFYNKNKVRVGDEIVIEGVKGKVVLIDTNSLVIQTNESAIIFPLSKLTTQKVEIIYPEGQDERLINSGMRQ